MDYRTRVGKGRQGETQNEDKTCMFVERLFLHSFWTMLQCASHLNTTTLWHHPTPPPPSDVILHHHPLTSSYTTTDLWRHPTPPPPSDVILHHHHPPNPSPESGYLQESSSPVITPPFLTHYLEEPGGHLWSYVLYRGPYVYCRGPLHLLHARSILRLLYMMGHLCLT